MRAMIIDDSRAMRLLLRRIVTGAGFDVVEAMDGRHALDVLESLPEPPRFALVDWNMPNMNGLAFIAAARQQPRLRDMALVMVTTEAEQSQIVRALAAGAHEYVIKPFTADALLDRLSLLGLLPIGANK